MSKVASFEIEFRQYLDHQGRIVNEPLPDFADDPADLVPLYELMTRTRVFDTKAIALQRTGKLGTYASCLGHEAIHVAIGAAMREEDCFVPMYREYGAQFYRGVKMSEVLLYWGGDERGSDFSGPKHDFAWSVPIATQCLHAAGAALAYKLRGEKRVAVGVVGDGGTSKGDFYEAINAAGAFRAPLVMVVVNNQWAISVPRNKQSGAETLAQKAIAAGLPGIQVDGNDLIASYDVVHEAVERARRGEGGTVIEAITYRLSDHTTADDAKRYRDDKEVKEAEAREPLVRLRKYLTDNGAWDDGKEQKLREQCAKDVDDAVNEYLNTEIQPPESMFDYLFANMPESLRAQREQAIEEARENG